jgi:hypothetical protein
MSCYSHDFVRQGLLLAGRIDKARDEYQALIEQATILSDGLFILLTIVCSLRAQNDARIRKGIANSSHIVTQTSSRDSTAIKALAVIIMLFLPSSTFAAVLSTPVLDWTQKLAFPTAIQSISIFEFQVRLYGVISVYLELMVRTHDAREGFS